MTPEQVFEMIEKVKQPRNEKYPEETGPHEVSVHSDFVCLDENFTEGDVEEVLQYLLLWKKYKVIRLSSEEYEFFEEIYIYTPMIGDGLLVQSALISIIILLKRRENSCTK
jgi:hypothetical protein